VSFVTVSKRSVALQQASKEARDSLILPDFNLFFSPLLPLMPSFSRSFSSLFCVKWRIVPGDRKKIPQQSARLLSKLTDLCELKFLLSLATTTSTLPGDSRGYRSAEEAARELTHGIRREGTKLAERWAALRDRTDRWNMELDSATRVSSLDYLSSCIKSSFSVSRSSTWSRNKSCCITF